MPRGRGKTAKAADIRSNADKIWLKVRLRSLPESDLRRQVSSFLPQVSSTWCQVSSFLAWGSSTWRQGSLFLAWGSRLLCRGGLRRVWGGLWASQGSQWLAQGKQMS